MPGRPTTATALPRQVLARARGAVRLAIQHAGSPLKLLSNLVLRASHALHLTKVPVLPSALDIEPNNYCNFRCQHCQVTHWSKPHVDMTLDRLASILDSVPSLLSVKLQGMGEPLLNRDLLPMLAAVEARGISTSLITNGSVMSDAVCSGLLGLSGQITFSIDGASAEVFEASRAGGSFAKVAQNVKKLASGRKRRTPRLEAWTVVTRHNWTNLADIVRLVSSLGLDHLTLQLLLTGWGKSQMESVVSPLRVFGDPRLDQELAKVRLVAAELGLALRVTSDHLYSREQKCGWPWRSAYIASNGDVVPCCVLADSETVTMGNVFALSFRSIWNSQSYRDLRMRIRKHQLPDSCRSCYADP